MILIVRYQVVVSSWLQLEKIMNSFVVMKFVFCDVFSFTVLTLDENAFVDIAAKTVDHCGKAVPVN